jgi:predicted ribosome quality control (RQC) complex YloA/Tae2 family protein
MTNRDSARSDSGSSHEDALALLEASRSEAVSLLGKVRRRLSRRADAIRGDLARAAQAEVEAERARWFVVEAARAPRGTAELTATDWSSGEATLVRFALDPTRAPREQIDAVFHRARRLVAGRAIAESRLSEATAKLVAVDDARAALAVATTLEDVERAAQPWRGAPAIRERDRRPVKGDGLTRRPYRVFASGEGATIYVGRGAADNDALTFRVAKPRDLWLHAKGTAGAHVVLPLEKGKEPTPDALVDAAHLAAHFSSAREEPAVEVTYARRGRVRKPRGSPPGLVVVDHGKTMVLRVSPERLRRLLASETGAPG